MPAANNKTQPRPDDVSGFLRQVQPDGRRQDGQLLCEMMQRITGLPPVLWGPSIVGFGQYHYVYDSGREGDSFLTGFAPRKANMVVYIMPGFKPYSKLLPALGKHRAGASCLYLGRLSQIDLTVLETLISRSVADMQKKYSNS